MIRTCRMAAIGLLAAALVHAQSEDFGAWKTLFNGKDLAGWVNVRGEKAGQPPHRWLVEDGTMTNQSAGVDDICTAEEFENYELELQYRIPARGNSGVYLRGAIEVQIADNSGVTDPAKLSAGHAGGVYGARAPLANPQKAPNEWNTYIIRHIGHRVTVRHNGTLVQDNIYVPKNTPGCHPKYQGSPTKGPVMFQGDHSKVWYRAIRIRPIASGEGWRPLFTGVEDLASVFSSSSRPVADDQNKVKDAWVLVDHSVSNQKANRDMWTREAFGNFLVHYEYRSDPASSGNSGFYLRDQWELQILKTESLTSIHTDGAFYDMFPRKALSRTGPDQWNHMEVKVEGMRIWVWQNGVLIHDGVICERRTDNRNAPTLKFSRAPFKFQGDHDKVWFTNLFIKELPDS